MSARLDHVMDVLQDVNANYSTLPISGNINMDALIVRGSLRQTINNTAQKYNVTARTIARDMFGEKNTSLNQISRYQWAIAIIDAKSNNNKTLFSHYVNSRISSTDPNDPITASNFIHNY